MNSEFSAVPITKHVYWVGAIDWNIRDFHGYATSRGTTYNAYLIMDKKITLIDTVKRPFFPEMLARIRSVVDPSKIDIIVSNHAEMDHSGSLPEAIELIRPEQVYASSMGTAALQDHFHWKTKVLPVKDQEKISLGELELQFFETRMLHWPDSMFTWIAKEKLLFSQDAFGMHLASARRFADELPETRLVEEGAKYFANILLPYAPLIPKLIERCRQLGLNAEIIAPDHGPIFRQDLGAVLERYLQWSAQKPTDKIVIVYDTMWESTHMLARQLEEQFQRLGHPVRVLNLHVAHRSDVITELLDAGAICVGSPTLNNQMFPTLADFLTYAAGLKPQHLLGLAFGSYGWSGESIKKVADALTSMGVEVLGSCKCKYRPDEETRTRCRHLATELSNALRAKLEQG
ncbi:FprA family A-type flavoprotein [Myxococcota bacterium]|nr:FprA family A-type flavoprotein [Myxococcota bacterium]MBU1410399.1 FprA family A-type flavoprotein [Myxococcota bacterium]MBU1511828.1 FprA family A-type flavoprotein [Myxococcota bacterium]